jgi:hypothetical protein
VCEIYGKYDLKIPYIDIKKNSYFLALGIKFLQISYSQTILKKKKKKKKKRRVYIIIDMIVKNEPFV